METSVHSSCKRKTGVTTRLVSALAIGLAGSIAILAPQPSAPGRISGKVPADRGEARAFRVKARDTEHRIIYSVLTNKGRYQIFNLPAGRYDVQVMEIGFDSPVQTVVLGPAETKTV